MNNRWKKETVKRWAVWAGIIVTVVIFVSSQIFVYGKVVGVFEEHIKNAPTNEGISKRYIDNDEFSTIKQMILYLYQKEGGK